MPEPKQFYVYVHRRATNGRIFYVGKGFGPRAWTLTSRNPHWRNVYSKHGFEVDIIRNFQNEECALTYEKILIFIIGKENLANQADGGGKNSGWKHSEKWKRAASEWQSGPRNVNFGKVMSQEQRDKIAGTLRGRPSPLRGVVPVRDEIARGNHIRALWQSENNPWANAKKSQGWLNKRQTSTPVETTCGMKFGSMALAVKWLQANGWPKASASKICLCCSGKRKRAYGHVWRKQNGTT